jgi:formylglycine-generating enzyme required for sulfatase activity
VTDDGTPPDADPDAWKDEAGRDGCAHPVELQQYFLSRYPVTVAQWRTFYDWCAVHDEGRRVWRLTWDGPTPGEWRGTLDPDSVRGPDTRPVTEVSWYDALAYCAWLTARLRADVRDGVAWTRTKAGSVLARRLTAADPAHADRPWVVTLASEAEWEKGARGSIDPEHPTEARRYPWGPHWDPNKANGNDRRADDDRPWTETQVIGSTSAVGSFPKGASLVTVEDLSGNVDEWTRSRYQPYPYESDERGTGREDCRVTDDAEPRVLRGGAFRYDPGHLRSAYRYTAPTRPSAPTTSAFGWWSPRLLLIL